MEKNRYYNIIISKNHLYFRWLIHHENILVSDSGTKDASLSLGGRIMIPTFLKLMSDHKREPESETDICAAFKEFDLDGSGLISLKELKKMMTGMGEKLSDEEFDSMLKEAKISSNGEVKYEEFVKSLFSKWVC